MFKITVPSKSFEGRRCGVQFRKGEAFTEDKAVVEALKPFGYVIEEIKEEKAEPKKAPKKKSPKKED